MFVITRGYTLAIKHGLLENGPFIRDFPIKTSIPKGFFSQPCLITRGYPFLFHSLGIAPAVWPAGHVAGSGQDSCARRSARLQVMVLVLNLPIFWVENCKNWPLHGDTNPSIESRQSNRKQPKGKPFGCWSMLVISAGLKCFFAPCFTTRKNCSSPPLSSMDNGKGQRSRSNM